MKEPQGEGVANHADLESCAGSGDTTSEVLTEAPTSRLSSRESLIFGQRPRGQKGERLPRHREWRHEPGWPPRFLTRLAENPEIGTSAR